MRWHKNRLIKIEALQDISESRLTDRNMSVVYHAISTSRKRCNDMTIAWPEKATASVSNLQNSQYTLPELMKLVKGQLCVLVIYSITL